MIFDIFYLSCTKGLAFKNFFSDYGMIFDEISILIVNTITLFFVFQILFHHFKARCILWNNSRKIRTSSHTSSRPNTTEMILVEQSGDITPSITTNIPLLPAPIEAPNRKSLFCC